MDKESSFGQMLLIILGISRLMPYLEKESLNGNSRVSHFSGLTHGIRESSQGGLDMGVGNSRLKNMFSRVIGRMVK